MPRAGGTGPVPRGDSAGSRRYPWGPRGVGLLPLCRGVLWCPPFPRTAIPKNEPKTIKIPDTHELIFGSSCMLVAVLSLLDPWLVSARFGSSIPRAMVCSRG